MGLSQPTGWGEWLARVMGSLALNLTMFYDKGMSPCGVNHHTWTCSRNGSTSDRGAERAELPFRLCWGRDTYGTARATDSGGHTGDHACVL